MIQAQSPKKSAGWELLPSTLEDFRNKSYWDVFFTKTHGGAFEWYGDYEEWSSLLIDEFHSLIPDEENKNQGDKKNDNKRKRKIHDIQNCGFLKTAPVLNVGCGNSDLPALLHDELNIGNIVSVDFSEVAISEMKVKNKNRSSLKWECLDVSNGALASHFGDQKFSFILDKGFADAYLSGEEGPEFFENLWTQYFSSLWSIMDIGSKLFLITLAQPYISQAVTKFFYQKNLTMKVVPLEAGATLSRRSGSSEHFDVEPVAFIITKLGHENLPPRNFAQMVFDYSMCTDSHIQDLEQPASVFVLTKYLGMFRRNRYVVTTQRQVTPGRLEFFTLQPLDPTKSSYTVSVYDCKPPGKDSKLRKSFRSLQKKTVGILVPLGEQHHYIYNTPAGNQKLAETASAKRVICIFVEGLSPFDDLKKPSSEILTELKADIGEHLVQLSLSSKIVIMTQNENMADNREPVFKTSGPNKVQVFDAAIDAEDDSAETLLTAFPKASISEFKRRVLVFQDCPRVAQSEVVIQVKNNKDKIFHWSAICNGYFHLILCSLSLCDNIISPKDNLPVRGLVIGLGGGVLPSVLKMVYKNIHLQSIEIDPQIAEIAKTYFNFSCSDENQLLVKDGIQHLHELAQQTTDNPEQDTSQFDFIVMDSSGPLQRTDRWAGLVCPCAEFLDDQCLIDTVCALKTNGIFIVNVLTRNQSARQSVVYKLKAYFASVAVLQTSQDVNEVFICCRKRNPNLTQSALQSRIYSMVDKFSTEFELVKKLTPSWDIETIVSTLQHP